MNEKILRTFIAVPVPADLRSKKTMLYSTIDESKGNINWVKNNQLHLTIKYLGNTPESEFEKIITNINNITNKMVPFRLNIENTGCFPVPERPRVLWMGIKGILEPLHELVMMIEESMDNLGFPKEQNDYHPHITLAKIKYPQKITPDISLFLNSTYDPIVLEVDRVQFFSSELLPSGTIYTLIKSFPLGETL